MNDEFGKDLQGNLIVYSPGICLKGLDKNTKILSHDAMYTSRDSKEHIPHTSKEHYRYTNLCSNMDIIVQKFAQKIWKTYTYMGG